MKFLERLSLSIFSLIVLVLSVVVILICFNFVQPTILEIPFEYILAAETNLQKQQVMMVKMESY